MVNAGRLSLSTWPEQPPTANAATITRDRLIGTPSVALQPRTAAGAAQGAMHGSK